MNGQRGVCVGFIIILLVNLTSCMGGGRAPVYSREDQRSVPAEKRPIPQKVIPGLERRTRPITNNGYYIVVHGDTLYSIAWRYKFDYKRLAKWNGIRPPYVIYTGKKLRLLPPPVKSVQTIVRGERSKPYPKPKPPIRARKPVQNGKQTPVKPPSKITWQWPAKGKLISSNTVSARNGIDIKGKIGQTVKAAGAGKIVYSGSGLVGYGNLLIIKHNKSFLSAYAHNSRLLVSEGTKVSAGQPIAEMGNSATNKVKLHFEIRKDGKSVDPLKYLPK